MMISQTSLYSPYSVYDWFIKDIAVTLIKYGYELDTAFYDWLFLIRLHSLKSAALSFVFIKERQGSYDSSRY
jgi:hypothetical protein